MSGIQGRYILRYILYSCIVLVQFMTTEGKLEKYPEPAGQEKGIDVSHWQKDINWNTVAKDGKVKHAFIKMTEGATGVDKKFATNWKEAKAAGIKVNCYHYFRALDANGQNQEQYIVSQKNNIKKNAKAVGFEPSKNILAIDVEKTGNEKASPAVMATNLKKLLDLIKKDPDMKSYVVMIYTSPGYWNSAVDWKDRGFDAYPLWVAHYGVSKPTIPKPWKNWSWWQYSDKGKVPGISTDVDLDWVNN